MAQAPNPALTERMAANRRGKLTKDQYRQIVGHLERMRRFAWVGVLLVIVSPVIALVVLWLGSNNPIAQFIAVLVVVAGVGAGFRIILELRNNDRLRPVLEAHKVEGRQVEIVRRWFRGSVDRATGKPIKYLGMTLPINPGTYRIYFLQGTDHAISCETLEEQAGSQK